jgi:hypothetical protein
MSTMNDGLCEVCEADRAVTSDSIRTDRTPPSVGLSVAMVCDDCARVGVGSIITEDE